MSGSSEIVKPAQTGLVDMGDISFYDGTIGATPPFTLGDLENSSGIALYGSAFSEIVLNVTWAELEPAPGTLDVSAIHSALTLVADYNALNHTDLGIKLRIWGGYTAPDWAKQIDGPPISIPGKFQSGPHATIETVGRYWTADYIDAWTSFQDQLAASYDNNGLIRGISNTAGAEATDEPFVPPYGTVVADEGSQSGDLLAAGYSDAAQQLTLRGAIADYAGWATTPLDYTMNLFHLQQSTPPADANFTLAVLQEAENSGRIVQAGNHALNDPWPPADSFIYAQMAVDAALDPTLVPGSYQTASPVAITPNHNYDNLGSVIVQGVSADAGDIELWDGTAGIGTSGTMGVLSAADIEALAGTLAAGIAPSTGARDDGKPLGFIAPGVVTGPAGAIALSGVDAVLLNHGEVSGSYTVTIMSTGGDTVAVTDFGGIVSGPSSGATIVFSGSLDAVNTVLASLTDSLHSGSDVLQISASDGSGHTAVHSVGIQVAAAAASPADTAMTADFGVANGTSSYTWTGGGSDPLFSNADNWSPTSGPPGTTDIAAFTTASPGLADVAGVGAAATLIVDNGVLVGGESGLSVGQNGTGDVDIATTPGSSGMLVLGALNSTLAIAGNLEIGGSIGGVGVLLAALAPSDYSTTELTIGGTLDVGSQGSARFSGALNAGTIDLQSGGLISGDGSLAATSGGTIVNDGVIEVVADRTLGLQQLAVANVISGSGVSLIDPAATLILAEAVESGQTIAFAPNSIAQLSDEPYSPSTLVLQDPAAMQGTIAGFGFADSIALQGVTASDARYDAGSDKLFVDLTNGGSLSFALSGDLAGLQPFVATVADATTVTFVAADVGLPPGVSAPPGLQGTEGHTVVVPGIVLQTPLPANPVGTLAVQVTLVAGTGELAAGDDGGNTVIQSIDQGTKLILSGVLGAVESSLQTLTYQGANGQASDSIVITAADSIATTGTTAISAAATIQVYNTAAVQFDWISPGGGTFGDAANWHAGGGSVPAPPGSANIATLGSGDYTVTGDAAVGQLQVTGTVTLTGQIAAQGRDAAALDVDSNGALTLAGGAVLTGNQVAIVGNSGDGRLTFLGGALNLVGNASDDALVIGEDALSSGTVLDFEQIDADGTVLVGDGGSGTLRLLGIASTVSDGGAEIGVDRGAHGAVVVDGGAWATTGQLTVGDQGSASLTIGGTANGLAGQVTAFDVVIGAQAGGSGSVAVVGGDLLVADATASSSALAIGVAGAGTLTVDGGGNVTVGVAEALVNDNTLYNTGTLMVGGTLQHPGLLTVSDGGSVLVDGDTTIGGTLGVGTVDIGRSATDSALLAMVGTLTIGASSEVALDGVRATIRASTVRIDAGGTLFGAGTLSGDGGGGNTVLLSDIVNDGTIAASGGELLIYGGLTGTGMLETGDTATLVLQAGVTAGQTLQFDAGGRAMLNDVGAFAGKITGFAVGDTLDLASTDATSATWQGGTLSLATDGGSIQLVVTGTYAPDGFAVRSDGLGDTLIELACFAAGTRILTPSGMVAIESLSPGVCVLTVNGGRKPIHWIGTRRVDCLRHKRPQSVWPILIEAGAFGAGCPIRDLYLSPDHAVYADGVLIPVKYLINGTTLRQIAVATIDYYHLELASHDVVLAEGLPAETFLDIGNRGAFGNAPGAVQLHPNFAGAEASLLWDALAYAPLCVTGPKVDRVRLRLNPRGVARRDSIRHR